MIAGLLRSALACTALGACIAVAGCIDGSPDRTKHYGRAPELAGIEGWLNSPPLTIAGLRGKVVLLEFWTNACINCRHVLPHTVEWSQRYRAQGLVVIGVHTPETDAEMRPEALQRAIRDFGIAFPVALDNRYATWNAYGTMAWPTLYLIDRNGVIVRKHIGEGGYPQTEAAIRKALEERP